MLELMNIADASLSVILTSGTLSPMSSFHSELGVQFGTSLEAPHVINVESQYDVFVVQDALRTSLEEICKVVPSGCLEFFPSYKLMDKLCSR
ncbi:unnamed protein product [Lactuca virosa]|uniref:Helicase ATP-binding domain-containing protein n=1 Tax=Lactuca virosa TaxID=75947 RepID=A0AAU9PP08_9ASTR|nr:unnamed protein product [Lactuca virosa]